MSEDLSDPEVFARLVVQQYLHEHGMQAGAPAAISYCYPDLAMKGSKTDTLSFCSSTGHRKAAWTEVCT